MKLHFLPQIPNRLRRRSQSALALFAVLVAVASTADANTPAPSKAKARDSKVVKSADSKMVGCTLAAVRTPIPQFEPCYRFMWRYR
jgi:hypothetical protein